MKQNRTENSVRNIFFGFLNRLASVIIPFIFRTLIIKILGEEYLGINSLFSSILQVLNIAELGVGNAIAASMYQPIAEGDTNTVSALLNLYRKIYHIIGIVILCIGVCMLPFLPKLINGVPPKGINIYLLFLIYLCNAVVSYLFFAYKVTLVNAHQRMDLTESVGIIAKLITTGLQLAAIIIFKNITLYVFFNLLCTITYNFGCARVADTRFPVYACHGEIEVNIRKDIFKNIVALTIQKIGNTVSLSLDTIIISAFLGLTAVAVYGNYFYVISAISIFISLLYSAITASIGNSIATETVEKNYNDFRKIIFLNIWIIGWCSICFLCLFQDFMIVWMGKNLLLDMTTVCTLILRFFFEQIRKVVLTYKDSLGMWWIDKWRPLVGSAVNLCMNILLVQVIGVAGVAISTILSYVLIEHPWETHVLFNNYFHRKKREYYLEMLRQIFILIISGVITYFICSFLAVTGVAAIAIKLTLCIILPNIIFIFMNCRNKYFTGSLEIIKKVLFLFVTKVMHTPDK